MLFMLTMERSASRRPSCRTRALTNSCRCLAMWYSAFSVRSPSAAAFLISLGSSWISSCSSASISSCSFRLIASVMREPAALRDYKPCGGGLRGSRQKLLTAEIAEKGPQSSQREADQEQGQGQRRRTGVSVRHYLSHMFYGAILGLESGDFGEAEFAFG